MSVMELRRGVRVEEVTRPLTRSESCMRPDDEVRLRHLTESAEMAIHFAAGRKRADLDDDEMLRLALTKLLEIVGEAARQVTPETRAALPEVPLVTPPAVNTGCNEVPQPCERSAVAPPPRTGGTLLGLVGSC